MKPILVGLHNPYTSDPAFALWPHPRGSSGDRLCRMLGLGPTEYLDRFERLNLLSGGYHLVWSSTKANQARKRACDLMEHYAKELEVSRSWILLGARVTRAFGLPYEPLTARLLGSDTFTVLPHPSGCCRKWNAPGAIEYVKRLATQSAPAVAIKVEVR